MLIKDKKDDKRCKLSSEQKKEIVELYLTGEFSQRDLAKRYSVSRRTIQFTLDPNKRESNYQRRVENGGSKQYYNKDEHTKAMQKHREHKRELLKEDKLINKE